MLVRVFIVVLLSFDFFDDCPSNSKTGHEQRRPADSPLRLIVVNLLQHVRTFAAYGLMVESAHSIKWRDNAIWNTTS